MFQQAEGQQADRGRSRALIGIFVVVVVLAGAGVLAYSRFSPPPDPEAPPAPKQLANAIRADHPEFQNLLKVVQLNNIEKATAGNMLGQHQAIVQGQLVNMSEKTITGIELRGNVYNMKSEVVATTIALPVPVRRESLPPKSSMPFTVVIDGAPAPSHIADITVDIEGLEVR